MPVISMFHGLIASLYYLDNKQHHLAHIHVRYGEMEGVFAIGSGDLLEGKLPKGKLKLVAAGLKFIAKACFPIGNWQ